MTTDAGHRLSLRFMPYVSMIVFLALQMPPGCYPADPFIRLAYWCMVFTRLSFGIWIHVYMGFMMSTRLYLYTDGLLIYGL